MSVVVWLDLRGTCVGKVVLFSFGCLKKTKKKFEEKVKKLNLCVGSEGMARGEKEAMTLS